MSVTTNHESRAVLTERERRFRWQAGVSAAGSSGPSVVRPIGDTPPDEDPMALDPLSPINPPADPWFRLAP
jgi:hypothetical protein